MSPLCYITSVAQSLNSISILAMASSLYHTNPLKRYCIINSSLYLQCIKHPPLYIHYVWTRRYVYNSSPSTLDIRTVSQTHLYSVITVSLYLVLQTPSYIFPFSQTPCPILSVTTPHYIWHCICYALSFIVSQDFADRPWNLTSNILAHTIFRYEFVLLSGKL